MDQPPASSFSGPRPIAAWSNVDAAIFHNEIVPLGQPAVLKGLVAHWPAVQAGRETPRAFCDYLKRFDTGQQVETLMGGPEIEGRFYYRDDMSGLNFDRKPEPLAASLDRLLAHLDDARPPALSVQSTPVDGALPGFAAENIAPALMNAASAPRIWIGNAITVQTHYDIAYNIACVAAGHRRFTLFPPDQVFNLYLGPLEFTPAGTPVSMVQLHAPDHARYPRFAQAFAAAQQAELEPGDALYIPFFWWHHVQSLDRFNALINYWWNAAKSPPGTAYECLLHCVMMLRDLPADQRAAWRAMFDHIVFQTEGEAFGHLAPENRGLLGPMTLDRIKNIRTVLARSLGREIR